MGWCIDDRSGSARRVRTRRPRRGERARAVRVAALAVLGGALLGAHPPDPGIQLEVDLERMELTARDVRTGEVWERVSVVVGSPAAPTPRGVFRAGRVLLRPSWTPGARAQEYGALPQQPSLETPMGVAKIPFADGGAVALHGAGHRWLLGKPLSAGCVRVHDADLLRLLAWFERRGALGSTRGADGGESERVFVRPVRIQVH